MDNLRKETDKELKKIEDELARIYSDAEDELREKWDKYMQRAEKRLAGAENALQDALKSGDADAIAAAKKQLQEKIASATFRDNQFQDMIDGVTERMAHVNQIALEYVNGRMPDMYRYNYNGTLNAMKTEATAFQANKNDTKVELCAGKVFLAERPARNQREPPMGGAAPETLLPVWAQPCCWRFAPQQSPFPRPAAVQN